MHASSYQINIATAQQVAKENSPPEDCTRDWCLTVLSATITTRPMGKKTWQKATESSVPRMVGNLVYGVSPVSAAFSFGRRDFYALFVEEGLDLSSIHRKKVSQEIRIVCILNPNYSIRFGYYAMHVYESLFGNSLGVPRTLGQRLAPNEKIGDYAEINRRFI
ncbi:BnaC03g74200D [Brassica napus]|uniref:Uncharacterized protein n=2 Tax=Brassica TaxID=3705 RepID=A0A3P6BEG1_BRAOL|nr:unnamed protein product [Brassica napus]CDY61591.1 BnaC03g74200D [Brassica napus]VDC94388.1 unnamed protein product [Brassica oleracea]